MNSSKYILLALGIAASSSTALATDQNRDDDLSMSMAMSFASPDELAQQAALFAIFKQPVEVKEEKTNEMEPIYQFGSPDEIALQEKLFEIYKQPASSKESPVKEKEMEKEKRVTGEDLRLMGEVSKEITIDYNNLLSSLEKDQYNDHHQLLHLKKTFDENNDQDIQQALGLNSIADVNSLRDDVKRREQKLANMADQVGAQKPGDKEALISGFMKKTGCTKEFAARVYDEIYNLDI